METHISYQLLSLRILLRVRANRTDTARLYLHVMLKLIPVRIHQRREMRGRIKKMRIFITNSRPRQDPSSIRIQPGPSASTTQSTSASCTFNNQTIASGSSVTVYQSSSVPAGQQCVSQQRTCTNGTLSGSFTNSSCVVASASATPNLTVISVGNVTTVSVNRNGMTAPNIPIAEVPACVDHRRRMEGISFSDRLYLSLCLPRQSPQRIDIAPIAILRSYRGGPIA